MKLALHWPSIPRYIRSIFFYYDKSQSKQRCENILPFALKILLPFKWGKVNQNCFMDLLSMDRPVRMLQACKAALIEIVPSKLKKKVFQICTKMAKYFHICKLIYFAFNFYHNIEETASSHVHVSKIKVIKMLEWSLFPKFANFALLKLLSRVKPFLECSHLWSNWKLATNCMLKSSFVFRHEKFAFSFCCKPLMKGVK